VLGCLCFPYVKTYTSHKLEPQAFPCVFLNYSTSQKGYHCLHIQTNKIYISRHVRFEETTFPFQNPLEKQISFGSFTSAQADFSGQPTVTAEPSPLFHSSLSFTDPLSFMGLLGHSSAFSAHSETFVPTDTIPSQPNSPTSPQPQNHFSSSPALPLSTPPFNISPPLTPLASPKPP
jgi:hypothetical protein